MRILNRIDCVRVRVFEFESQLRDFLRFVFLEQREMCVHRVDFHVKFLVLHLQETPVHGITRGFL